MHHGRRSSDHTARPTLSQPRATRAGRTALVAVRASPARQHVDLDVRARCSCQKDLRSTTRNQGTRQGHVESKRARGIMPVGVRDAGWTD